ncbi:hypothetical protein S100027_04659 (plasmid) [Bacillus licheniformis]|nr:hypothetical protein S100027_04659 [Bacillus licheniformis]
MKNIFKYDKETFLLIDNDIIQPDDQGNYEIPDGGQTFHLTRVYIFRSFIRTKRCGRNRLQKSILKACSLRSLIPDRQKPRFSRNKWRIYTT